MSHRSRGYALPLMMLVACPGDEPLDTAAADSETMESSETAPGDGDGDGDGDSGGEPTCPASVPGRYDVFAESVLEPRKVYVTPEGLDELCEPAEDLFGLPKDRYIPWAIEPVNLLIYRPARPGSGEWPEGRFPVVLQPDDRGFARQRRTRRLAVERLALGLRRAAHAHGRRQDQRVGL